MYHVEGESCWVPLSWEGESFNKLSKILSAASNTDFLKESILKFWQIKLNSLSAVAFRRIIKNQLSKLSKQQKYLPMLKKRLAKAGKPLD